MCVLRVSSWHQFLCAGFSVSIFSLRAPSLYIMPIYLCYAVLQNISVLYRYLCYAAVQNISNSMPFMHKNGTFCYSLKKGIVTILSRNHPPSKHKQTPLFKLKLSIQKKFSNIPSHAVPITWTAVMCGGQNATWGDGICTYKMSCVILKRDSLSSAVQIRFLNIIPNLIG